MFQPVVLSKEYLSTPLQRYCRPSDYPTHSEIGLELEIEGFGAANMQAYTPGTYWSPHQDPSLRGDCIELTLRRPVSRQELPKALEQFEGFKRSVGWKSAISQRCSVHVHINFAHRTTYSLIKFLTLYAMFEPLFFEKVGSNRKGNPFCLRMSEANKFIRDFAKTFTKMNFNSLADENVRYMALNLNALHKFGSVEVRLHEGTDDIKVVQDWINVLLELVDFADTNYDMTPQGYIYHNSEVGLEGFAVKHLPKTHEYLKKYFGRVSERLSIDVAQDLAFCSDWVNAPTEAPVIKENKRGKKSSTVEVGLERDFLRNMDADVLIIDDENPWARVDNGVNLAELQMQEHLNMINLKRAAVKPKRVIQPHPFFDDEEGL